MVLNTVLRLLTLCHQLFHQQPGRPAVGTAERQGAKDPTGQGQRAGGPHYILFSFPEARATLEKVLALSFHVLDSSLARNGLGPVC